MVDMNHCPQSESEFREYFYALTGQIYSTDAVNWEAVMSAPYPWQGQQLRIPEGVGPGIQQPPDAPFFGLTQQWSNGPKARIFLPSSTPDGLGYFTRCLQYLDDAADGHGLIWSWYYVAGNDYTPVIPADSSGSAPSGGGGLTQAQVQALIDAQCVKVGSRIALRTSGDASTGVPASLLCAESGGPMEDGQPVTITSRSGSPGPWEKFTVDVVENDQPAAAATAKRSQ